MAPGQSISHYQISGKLGDGGMGVVYKADDTTLRRTVALKFLPAHAAGDEDARKRLLAEARAAATLAHPNICTIFEIDEEHSFIAMEFLDGQTVQEKIQARPLPLPDAIEIAIAAAEGLRAAHARGVVHRDIKSANLMLTSDGRLKIMDFGLAQHGEQVRLTRTGETLGTPAYMSPEQILAEALDHRTDIWSLGVVIYEMVTGRLPFRGETGPAVSHSILNTDPEPPTALRSGVPIALDRLLAKMLAKDRARRYQSAADLLVDLRALRTSAAAGTGRQSLRDREGIPSRRAILVGLALAAVLTIAIGVWRYTRDTAAHSVDSLAVLPLKSLTPNADDAALELGMADTIISRLSQAGQLKVRPTSAIRKYATTSSDSMTAARELQVDAVLEGTLHRDGDRLRISVNLLRVADGASLWTDSFDVRFAGIFEVEDQVSSQVATRLQGRLNPGDQAKLTKRVTSNAEAYAAYTKGMYYMGAGPAEDPEPLRKAAGLFQRAIDLDPKFALAHAKLAHAHSVRAVFTQVDPALIEQAKNALAVAEQLDPALAEVHVVRGLILRSQYEGFQMEPAIRELRLAQKLDATAGLMVLSHLYVHVGLEDLWVPLHERAIELDPSNQVNKSNLAGYYYITDRMKEGLTATARFRLGPEVDYYRAKGMIAELRPFIEAEFKKNPVLALRSSANPAFLLALEGKHREAQATVPGLMKIARRDMAYHHVTYDMARVYALGGRPAEAVKFLQETADTGFPCYPLFQRDKLLDSIRKAPQFEKFLAAQKSRWESVKREFQ
jgi:serine/threonine protein kinase